MKMLREVSLKHRFQERLNPSELMFIWNILKELTASASICIVELPHTKSNMIQHNKWIIYCARYPNLKGLFRKGPQHTATTSFGRIICDEVKQTLGNTGFFTTDELPAYGISRNEKRLVQQANNIGDKDLVAMFVYDETEAKCTKNLLDELLMSSKIEIQRLINITY